MRILAAKFIKSCARVADCPADALPEIAVVGRSNVGKSALINLLLRQPALARVSRTPGRTQAVNFFEVTAQARAELAFHLVDLPGYGYAAVPHALQARWAELIEGYFATRPGLAAVLVLLDARREPDDLDRQLQRWLAVHAITPIYVATKSDQITRGQRASALDRLRKGLGLASEIAIISTSARTGEGRVALLGCLERILTPAD